MDVTKKKKKNSRNTEEDLWNTRWNDGVVLNNGEMPGNNVRWRNVRHRDYTGAGDVRLAT